MRINNIEEDDDYDWRELKECDYKSATPGPILRLNINEKVVAVM